MLRKCGGEGASLRATAHGVNTDNSAERPHNAAMESHGNLVEVRGLRFSYGKRPLLKGIDLDIPRGKVVAILGTSGSGKTTLLQLIAGPIAPAPGGGGGLGGGGAA